MTITVQRLLVGEFTNFIKKLLSIDKFIYLKINDGNIISNCYLPERDAVKVQSIELSSIFEINEVPDSIVKMSFLNGSHTVEALKHFMGLSVSAEITCKDMGEEYIATNLRLISDELTIDLPCADPSLGFQDMSSDQIKRVFNTDSNLFSFEVQTFHIDKLNSLFNLEKEQETFRIAKDSAGVKFRGETYDSLIASNGKEENNSEVMVYKKYLNLLDKESYNVTVCDEKIVWRSLDSNTLLTVATCINA